MKQVIPEIYISQCRQAIEFYQRLFGGELKNLQMSDDMELFRDKPGKVIHSELHVNPHCVFYFVDILDQQRAQTGNVTLVLHFKTLEETRRCYQALQQGGHVLMELQQTFWGAWHAILTDRFGAPWALSCAE